jgi:ribosomal protein L30E
VYNHLLPGLINEQYLLDKKFAKGHAEKVRAAKEENLAQVIWVASNCPSSVGSGRLEYIKELSKHIKVSVFQVQSV